MRYINRKRQKEILTHNGDQHLIFLNIHGYILIIQTVLTTIPTKWIARTFRETLLESF